MLKPGIKALSCLAAGTAFGLIAPAALAAPCADLDLPNPVYGVGGSAVTATLKAVGTALANLDEPITVLYADPGACPGYQRVPEQRDHEHVQVLGRHRRPADV